MLEKKIRDVIHGDIYFDNKFIEIIDTPEFQRLNRIKQLSTAYMIFPSATHSRFSHSIGTYEVMRRLIEHFRKVLEDLKMPIDDTQRNLALCAALLHDLGHGPFSHAFETAFPNEINNKSHEEWTTQIITDQSTQLNKVLKKNFGEDAPEKIAGIINKKDLMNIKTNLKEISIYNIISMLISSKLDADRMDYLLRDAYFTGVSDGTFDLDRLIASLDLDIQKGGKDVIICVKDRYISTLEEYISARYHMYKEVYLHPLKCEMEIIVKKIFYRLYELKDELECITNDKDENIEIPTAFVKIWTNKVDTITTQEYLALDDNVIMKLISDCTKAKDYVLSSLSKAFLNRLKFKRIYIQNGSIQDVEFFKKTLIDNIIIKSQSSQGLNFNWEKANFWIEVKQGNDFEKEALIQVRKGDGDIVPIKDLSKIIRIRKKDMTIDLYNIFNIIRTEDKSILYRMIDIIKKETSNATYKLMEIVKEGADKNLTKLLEVVKKESNEDIYKAIEVIKKENDKDLLEVVKIIKNKTSIDLYGMIDNIEKDTNEVATFINVELFLNEVDNMNLTFRKEDLNKVIDGFDNRKNIEIEKKYLIDKEKYEDIIKIIEKEGYELTEPHNIKQEDQYYDTNDRILATSNRTLRVRIKKENDKAEKKNITIKTPINLNNGTVSSERHEYEDDLRNDEELKDKKLFVSRYLPEIKFENLVKTLAVNNNRIKRDCIDNKREKQQVTDSKGAKEGVKFEIVFDQVKYLKDGNEIGGEYEVEIELKSDYVHRVELYNLTTIIEEKLQLTPNQRSKYDRGMELYENR